MITESRLFHSNSIHLKAAKAKQKQVTRGDEISDYKIEIVTHYAIQPFHITVAITEITHNKQSSA